ncbi:MAG: asparagine synthetase B family protein, partial [Woeseiaceae bacterium]
MPDTVRRDYEAFSRSRDFAFHWESIGSTAVLTSGDEPEGELMTASYRQWVAAGIVRLDNRADLERWAESTEPLSDLELVLRTLTRRGTRYVRQILGDFALVAWNAASRVAIAAVDPFALKKLYYARRDGVVAFASRAEVLALEDRYEQQYLAELVSICTRTPDLTAYSSVHAVPAATIAVLENGRLATHQYWSPYDFAPEPAWARSEREIAEMCRSLLATSVRLRLGTRCDTWAQLSGGMDSSSVVSTAQWLGARGVVAHGLAGTVTYADRQGTAADERDYSHAVARHWQLRNECVVDPPFWDHYALSRTDLPTYCLPVSAREHRMCTIVRTAGGRVLLTGIGGDELFAGSMLFFADWIARGNVWPAVREMARRAAIGRVPFWELAYRNAVLPLLPRSVQHRVAGFETQVPRWVSAGSVRRYGLRERGFVVSAYAGRVGQKYHDAIAWGVLGIGRALDFGVIPDLLEVRHPFLYRPLVELALRLPPELTVRPYARKWILREAMQGILPEVVRNRVGKGGPVERFAWSLTAQRPLLEPLLQDSILADLGIVNSHELRAAFNAAPYKPDRKDQWHRMVQATLTIEAWLQMRAGRWPRGGRTSSTRVVDQAHYPS